MIIWLRVVRGFVDGPYRQTQQEVSEQARLDVWLYLSNRVRAQARSVCGLALAGTDWMWDEINS